MKYWGTAFIQTIAAVFQLQVKTRSAQEVEQLNSLLQSRGSQFDSMAAQVERLQAELKEAHHVCLLCCLLRLV